jgi:transcription elongation factor Elf1
MMAKRQDSTKLRDKICRDVNQTRFYCPKCGGDVTELVLAKPPVDIHQKCPHCGAPRFEFARNIWQDSTQNTAPERETQ